ncbi:MAG: hypothetical protein GF350_13575 [Chitinivibrionales bacterium]|nr:hypothetical protein [Chitinivibrionales bacterium]
MKYSYAIAGQIILCASLAAFTADYYVSSSGNDSNNGSLNAPFQTIAKAAEILAAGDICYIKAGVYCETINPLRSGTPGSPILFMAYPGDKPVVSGSDTISGWIHHEGAIYKAPMNWNLGPGCNQVFVDGTMMIEARYPDLNQQWDTTVEIEPFEEAEHFYRIHPSAHSRDLLHPTVIALPWSGGDDGWASDAPPVEYVNVTVRPKNPFLHGRGEDFWKGAMVWNRGWANGGGGQIAGSKDSANTTIFYIDTDRIRWFRQFVVSGVLPLLDTENEWVYDNGTLYLWAPGGTNPSPTVVTAKKRDLVLDLSGESHIRVEGLYFHGGSATLAKSNNCIIENCHFRYISHYTGFLWAEDAIGGGSKEDKESGKRGIYVSGSSNIIRNCSVDWSAGSGVILSDTANRVENCRITNVDYQSTYAAGVLFSEESGEDTSIDHVAVGNTIYNAGRSCVCIGAVRQKGSNIKIINNHLYNSMCIAGDGGAIYGNALNTTHLEIGYNVFHDVFGEPGAYIYLDHRGGNHSLIHHNVLHKNPSAYGVFLPLVVNKSYFYNNTIVAQVRGEQFTFFDQWPDFAANQLACANNLDASDNEAHWRFADSINNDFRLTDSSPAIDAGVEAPDHTTDRGIYFPSVTSGFAGSAPDLGAFEYGGNGWSAGHDWGEPKWPVYEVQPSHTQTDCPQPEKWRVSIVNNMLVLGPWIRGDRSVRIFDGHGRLMLRKTLLDTNENTISLEGYGNGVFFIRISNHFAERTIKLIKS